ncbi:alpha-hydroxy-acid oxidizing protein [Modestobacter sp. DSM 44400]|uniref:alpha-hydroxy-acid oxidizing protein n=1 Tax=Modestobacter sp. DSM 44400 TaxID=1550230 RepID=UPI000B874FBB|nr:alpha-hydroxy-acid oxidizing protein [Modestobacter sp. DSM 44400]
MTSAAGTGRRRQDAVYRAGVYGRHPRVPTVYRALAREARRRLDARAYGYVAGGAGDEATQRADRMAFDAWSVVPRVLRDVSRRDTSVELFGRRLPAPVLLGPVGALELVHPEADLAVARAAAAVGVPMVFSNQASVPLEITAGAMGDSPRWMQLYWSTSDELVESLLGRAEAAGCEAVVVTLDTTMLGWRPRDLDLGHLPFALGKGIAQYTSDPVFRRLVEQRAVAAPPRDPQPRPTVSAVRAMVGMARAWSTATGMPVREALRSPLPRAAVEVFLGIYSRPSITWADLAWLRSRTTLPVVLKGVLHPDDARRAVEEGVDGVVVSTHGGRQVDRSIASLDALPDVVDAVGDRIPVLFDSGIRSGADVLVALALGARAALLGRPYAWGLGLAGEAGVRQVVEDVIGEFDLTLGLTGHTAVGQLTREVLRRTR